jgi:hypothetical protein
MKFPSLKGNTALHFQKLDQFLQMQANSLNEFEKSGISYQLARNPMPTLALFALINLIGTFVMAFLTVFCYLKMNATKFGRQLEPIKPKKRKDIQSTTKSSERNFVEIEVVEEDKYTQWD